ncbi:MAG: hypothetical protein HYV28_12035, partial [Ignavibacteriales bacterium]|nr:hypothetical protein [Ignavibacteriales bacterium]
TVELTENCSTEFSFNLIPGVSRYIKLNKNFKRKEEYCNGSSITKKLIILEELMESFEFICAYYKWDISALRNTYEICKKLNLEYEFLFGPVTLSRDRKHKAGVIGSMKADSVDAFVVIFDAKTGKIVKKVNIETLKYQYYYTFCGIFGKRGWINNSEYSVTDAGDYREYIVSFENDNYVQVLKKKDKEKLYRAAYNISKPKLVNYPEL